MLLSELTGKDTKAVVFDGVRAEESLRRSKYTEVGEGVKNIQQVNCHAILKWSSAEIFVYALKKNVLLNNAYRHGIYRVGCKVCCKSPECFATVKVSTVGHRAKPGANCTTTAGYRAEQCDPLNLRTAYPEPAALWQTMLHSVANFPR